MAFALSIAVSSDVSRAMTFDDTEMTCFDGSKFTARLQGSGSSFDRTLDLQQVGAILTPWPLAECPKDGFVFYTAPITPEFIARVRPLVDSPEYQALRKESTYYRAFWLRDKLGDDHWSVSWTLLEAVWQNHAYASQLIERLPADIAAASGDDQKAKRALRAELLRQVGRFAEAKQIYLELLPSVDPFGASAAVAKYEIKLIDAKDTAPRHLLSEAMKEIANDPDYQRASKIPQVSPGTPLQQFVVLDPEELKRNTGVKRLAWSPDSRTVIAAVKGGVAAYEVDGKEPALHHMGGASTEIIDGPDIEGVVGGLVLLSTVSPITLQALDARTLEPSTSFKVDHFVGPLVLGFDQKSIVYGTGSSAEIYQVDSGSVRNIGEPRVNMIAGSWFLKASDPTGPRAVIYKQVDAKGFPKGSFIVWDYSKNSQSVSLEETANGAVAALASVAYSPDGNKIYIASETETGKIGNGGDSCDIRLRDARTGQLIKKSSAAGMRPKLSVSADGRFVALACGKSVTLWSSDLEHLVGTLSVSGNAGIIPSIAFDPQAKYLAVHTGSAIVVYTVAN